MPKLSASYELKLPTAFRFEGMSGDWQTTIHLEGFDVLVVFRQPPVTSLERGDGTRIYHVNELRINVSRVEPGEPPPLGAEGLDCSARGDWFAPLIKEYRAVAALVADRLVNFLRTRMFVRALMPFPRSAFYQPVWTNAAGEEIQTGTIELAGSFTHASGAPELLGERDLTKHLLPEFVEALQSGFEPTTFEEFLADAKTSIAENKLQRGALELAIALEILVKQTFFAAASPASAAIEYLEDRGQARMQVKELLDEPARRAFGESLKEGNPDAFRDLDFLFRCRNKVAHRGILTYRDDRGIEHVVDRSVLQSWWQSVEVVVNWLTQKSGQRGLLKPSELSI